MAEKLTIQTQLEHLQQKTVGTGNPDSTKYEWLTNQHRDSYASYIGHPSTLRYFSVVSNQSVGRSKYEMLQVCRVCVFV
jgi:splicing factor 3B subunit 5